MWEQDPWGRRTLDLFWKMSVFWISKEKKVVVDQRDRPSKDSGKGRKKSVNGKVTGTVGYLLLGAKLYPPPTIHILKS